MTWSMLVWLVVAQALLWVFQVQLCLTIVSNCFELYPQEHCIVCSYFFDLQTVQLMLDDISINFLVELDDISLSFLFFLVSTVQVTIELFFEILLPSSLFLVSWFAIFEILLLFPIHGDILNCLFWYQLEPQKIAWFLEYSLMTLVVLSSVSSYVSIGIKAECLENFWQNSNLVKWTCLEDYFCSTVPILSTLIIPQTILKLFSVCLKLACNQISMQIDKKSCRINQ